MTPDDGTSARRSTVVTDGGLPARLLAFLEDRAGSSPDTPGDLPAIDPALVQRLRDGRATSR